MFNYLFKNNKAIASGRAITKKFINADEATKRKIFVIIEVAIACSILLVFVLMLADRQASKMQLQRQYDRLYKEGEILDGTFITPPSEKKAIGASFNPFDGFQETIITAFSEIVTQLASVFDNSVGITPNIALNDGEIKGANGQDLGLKLDRFYKVTTNLAWVLLPLLIAINGIYIVLEGSFKGLEIAKALAKKLIMFAVGMVAFRPILGLAISLVNAISNQVLEKLVVGMFGANGLSDSLFAALGLTLTDGLWKFTSNGDLSVFAQVILWIGLFFTIVALLFQFVIRLFHLTINAILYPIVLLFSLLPSGSQILTQYLEDIIRTLIVQPVFLIGLALSIEIINSVEDLVSKVVFGLGSLAFLGLIPALVNRFSGAVWTVGGFTVNRTFKKNTIDQVGKIKNVFSKAKFVPTNNNYSKLKTFKDAGNRSTKTQ